MTERDDISKDIGERLRALRGDKKQEQIAEGLGITAQILDEYEKGEYIPSIYQVKKIAEYYGVTADYILCITDLMYPPCSEMMKYKILSANRLKILRIKAGLKQADLAKEIGAGRCSYIQYESFASDKFPNSEQLINLSRKFGVTTDYILGLTDVKERK